MQQPTNQHNIMQNKCKTINALAAASALVAGTATAMQIDYEISTGYTSEYIFRGVNLGQDLVDVGLSAATEIDRFGISAGAWYATFRDNIPFDSNATDELDLFGSVTYDFDFLVAGVGYIWYYYPEAGGHTAEVPVSISRDWGIVDTSLTYFWDVRGDNDGYTELAITNETELNSCLTLSSGLFTGYLAERGRLCHITAKVALDYALTETATVSPFIAHSWALTEVGAYQGSKNQLFGGVQVAVSF